MSDSEDQGAARTALVDALQNSPLRLLPAELRIHIYSLVLEHKGGLIVDRGGWRLGDAKSNDRSPIADALALRATCKEIHRETEGLFFKVNDININLVQSRLGQVIPRIPSLLPTQPRPRLVIWPLGFFTRASASAGVGQKTLSETKRDMLDVLAVARTLHPYRVLCGFNVYGHRWYHTCGLSIYDKKICVRGAPLSMAECAFVRLIFPVEDQATALSIINNAHEKKLALLETHREHRACPVRAELDKLRASLEPPMDELQALIEATLAASPGTTKAFGN